MASRVDERGYEQNGNQRQREPYAGQDYDEEPRMSRTRRRDEREIERPREEMDERRFSERSARLSDAPSPTRTASTLSDAVVAAFERGAAVLGENIRLYQDETVRFMTQRLERDTALLEQLGKSRSMFDVFALQQQWFSDATRAYSDEIMRLGKLTRDASQRNANEARSAMSETRRGAYDAE